jgi:serine/threonine-protein kinase PpkA
MSTIYVGTEVSSNRQIAVKVLSKQNIDSTDFNALFLEGARLHETLKHPNIVKVLDFGSTDVGYYLVSEYLPGGDLNARLQRGMHVQALIKIIKDIGRALDYAHAVGVIHRDVKPENILFRGNGDAVLTDFDIAQKVTDQPSKTAHGTVIGTPEYMSPEQAAGRAIDGRSDLYSLGVVAHRMLTGDLPYKADTAVSIGIKHLQDPIPRLPNYLQAFQKFVDKALAKRPEQRFQRGEEMVEMLDMIRGDQALPESTIRTQAISTREIMAVGGDLFSTTRDSARQEKISLRLQRRRRFRNVAAFLILAGGLGSAGYYSFEQGLISPEGVLSSLGIGEDPELALAWSEAQSLRLDPNQGLAAIVAGYRRVLAMEPDHEAAQLEVAGLATDWVESITDALVLGNLEGAETRLTEATAVFPNDLQWLQLGVQLRDRQRADRIMVSAQALLLSNGMSDLPSATAAIQSFNEVLRLAPEHEEAAQALRELAVHYAGLANDAARSGEVTVAINLLERASAADGTLTELDDVRKLISQATTAQAAIDDLLQQARGYRADNQLIMPPGENAAELYHRVLATDPDNVFAAQGLDEVMAQITASADQLLADAQLEAVDVLVVQAAAAGLNDDVVNEIRRRLDAERTKITTIAASLTKAAELIEIGYLTAPSDNNAVASLRAIQQLDPGNEAAQALLRQCAERLASVAQEAYQFGLFEPAEQYLDLALTITPEVAEWVALRDSWEGDQG